MTYDKSQALAAVRRSARAAEKRLNATEAEIRFASDIAAGIYTADMVPSVMDADKIKELADCYIAEKAFEANDVQPEISLNPDQEDIPSAPLDASISIPFKPEDELLDMANSMRSSVAPIQEATPSPDTVGSSRPPKKSISISLYFFLRKLRPWTPAIILVILFVALCVSSFYPSPSSSDTTKGTSSSDDRIVPSLSVDYATSYVGSINSYFIHRRTCRHADNILEKNRVYYKSVDDALSDGRVKCSECFDTSSANTGSDLGGVKLVPLTPKNGAIINDTEEEKLAPLTIKASDSSNYYISLKCVDVPGKQYESSFDRKYDILKHNMSFYVEGGKTAEVLVPLAEYEIYYATGNTWHGSASKFGEDTLCFRCEDTFLFEKQWDDEGMYYSGWTLTLYAVPDGNMDTEEIPLSEFPS